MDKIYTLSFWGRTSSEDNWKQYEAVISQGEAGQIINTQDGWEGMVASYIREISGETVEVSLLQLELGHSPAPLEEVKSELNKPKNYYDRFRKNGVFSG